MAELTPEERTPLDDAADIYAGDYEDDARTDIGREIRRAFVNGYRAAEADCDRRIAAAVAAERERCAKKAKELQEDGCTDYCIDIAAAIGEQP